MADDPELRRFAERLVRRVRDRAIEVSDLLSTGTMKGPRGERWRSIVADDNTRHALYEVVPDIVDQVLFELLNSIDNDELPLGWRRADHSFVALEELGQGEMAGWLMGGAGGWLDQFSAQRFHDPLADLQPKMDEDAPGDL